MATVPRLRRVMPKLPLPHEKVDAGESAEVLLACLERFRVKEGQYQFKVTEGGRVVAEGSLKQC